MLMEELLLITISPTFNMFLFYYDKLTRVRRSKIVMNLLVFKMVQYMHEKLSVQISLMQLVCLCLLLTSTWV